MVPRTREVPFAQAGSIYTDLNWLWQDNWKKIHGLDRPGDLNCTLVA